MFQVLRLEVCSITPGLYSAGDETQGFRNARQAFQQLRYMFTLLCFIYNFLIYLTKKLLILIFSKIWFLVFFLFCNSALTTCFFFVYYVCFGGVWLSFCIEVYVCLKYFWYSNNNLKSNVLDVDLDAIHKCWCVGVSIWDKCIFF